jgi:hypothetical protein
MFVGTGVPEIAMNADPESARPLRNGKRMPPLEAFLAYLFLYVILPLVGS